MEEGLERFPALRRHRPTDVGAVTMKGFPRGVEKNCAVPELTNAWGAEALADVVRVAGALSNEKRFEILQMLYKGSLVSCCDRFEFGEQGVCVADVVGALGMSQSTISHHLSVLEEAGLIRRETRGLWTCYFPNPSAIEEFTVRIRQQLGVDMVSGGECGEVCNCKPR